VTVKYKVYDVNVKTLCKWRAQRHQSALVNHYVTLRL